LFLGLLALETSLIIGFWILPQFKARHSPDLGLEMETPLRDNLGTRVALVAFLGLLGAGNIGLVITVWRAFKELRINEQERIG
jgi:hypothetical protein